MERKPIAARSKRKLTSNKTTRRPRRSDNIYVLRLYVAGMNPFSQRAVENIKEICEENLAGRYDLEVIDIYRQPALAEGEQIIAAPTLVKRLPEPLRQFIGDMSDRDKILFGLDLRPKPSL